MYLPTKWAWQTRHCISYLIIKCLLLDERSPKQKHKSRQWVIREKKHKVISRKREKKLFQTKRKIKGEAVSRNKHHQRRLEKHDAHNNPQEAISTTNIK